MATFKPGDKVQITLTGFEHEGEFVQVDPTDSAYAEVGFFGRIFGVPVDLLDPVTPPCPWTEPGTVVACDNASIFADLYRLNYDGWYAISGPSRRDGRVEWSDLAPLNPVRLVPEVSS